MSIAEITVKVHPRYAGVLKDELSDANLTFIEEFLPRRLDGWDQTVFKIQYDTSRVMTVLKKYFDGLELMVAMDNTL